MKQVNVVRWSLSEAEYVEFDNGAIPSRGDVVFYGGAGCIVRDVQWHVDPDERRGYVRVIAEVRLSRVAPPESDPR